MIVMNNKLSDVQLLEIGVNPSNLIFPCGELNIIIQNDISKSIKSETMCPNIYKPRKNVMYDCFKNNQGYKLNKSTDKKFFTMHLRDSAERLKILSYYLTQQADEIEKYGFPVTNCLYPE